MWTNSAGSEVFPAGSGSESLLESFSVGSGGSGSRIITASSAESEAVVELSFESRCLFDFFDSGVFLLDFSFFFFLDFAGTSKISFKEVSLSSSGKIMNI